MFSRLVCLSEYTIYVYIYIYMWYYSITCTYIYIYIYICICVCLAADANVGWLLWQIFAGWQMSAECLPESLGSSRRARIGAVCVYILLISKQIYIYIYDTNNNDDNNNNNVCCAFRSVHVGAPCISILLLIVLLTTNYYYYYYYYYF